MPESVHIKRHHSSVPFGFKLQGGQDFSIPLSVLEVTPNSIAEQVGLRPGDAILKINNVETSWMDHNRGKQEIVCAGDDFWLEVQRNAVNNSYQPQARPLSALLPTVGRPYNKQAQHIYPVPQPIKTDLTVDKGPGINIGTSHNRAPMPFNRNVGTSVVYQAQKPTNWTPGDYTRLNEPSPTSSSYNEQASSIFDLKNGNPTGASVPRGFRSVMAPVELPPEQRHAPMRKEYQVQHNKANWIEPRMN